MVLATFLFPIMIFISSCAVDGVRHHEIGVAPDDWAKGWVDDDTEWFWTLGDLVGWQNMPIWNGSAFVDHKTPIYYARDILMNQKKWPPQLQNCQVQAGPAWWHLVEYIGGGAQGRVFLLGDQKHVVKFFKKLTDMQVEQDILDALNVGAAGASPYINHQATNRSRSSCCGLPCVVLEFVNGNTLAEILDDELGFTDSSGREIVNALFSKSPPVLNASAGSIRQNLPVPVVKSIMCQSLLAFRDMEASKVQNTDQNLRNIMLDPDGALKFIDFGLARNSTTWSTYPVSPDAEGFASPQFFQDLGAALPPGIERAAFANFVRRLYMYPTALHAVKHEICGGAGDRFEAYLRQENCLPVRRDASIFEVAWPPGFQDDVCWPITWNDITLEEQGKGMKCGKENQTISNKTICEDYVVEHKTNFYSWRPKPGFGKKTNATLGYCRPCDTLVNEQRDRLNFGPWKSKWQIFRSSYADPQYW